MRRGKTVFPRRAVIKGGAAAGATGVLGGLGARASGATAARRNLTVSAEGWTFDAEDSSHVGLRINVTLRNTTASGLTFVRRNPGGMEGV